MYLLNYLQSLKDSAKFDFGVVIVDNQSEINMKTAVFENGFDFVEDYIRIEDQSVSGLTGAWNVGIKRSSEIGEIIINTNEDLTFDNTINNFVSEIESDIHKDTSIYGPLTNGVSQGAHPLQFSNNRLDKDVIALKSERREDGTWSQVLNGFFLGFTSNFYNSFKKKDELFPIDHENNRGDGKWGGQEGIMIEWANKGSVCKVIPSCWINHIKDRTYRTARYLYGDGGL